MKNISYIFISLLIIVSSCQRKQESSPENKVQKIADFPKANDSQDFIGTYIGVLPCADCEGMETKLTINENNTFTKSVHYLGKGTKVFEQKGTISWNKLGNVIELNEVQNAPKTYLVSKNKLLQLDMEGNIIDGTMAQEYQLSKQTENSSATLENEITENEKVNLNNKHESSASVEKVNQAEGKFTLAETKWKLEQLNGKTIKQNGNKPNILKLNSADGNFSAYAGCNSMFGSYAMPSSNTISFSSIGATRMACLNMSTENGFMRMLESTKRYVLDKEILTFYGSGKTPIATFVAQN